LDGSKGKDRSASLILWQIRKPNQAAMNLLQNSATPPFVLDHDGQPKQPINRIATGGNQFVKESHFPSPATVNTTHRGIKRWDTQIPHTPQYIV
jgi:hypothetical protein